MITKYNDFCIICGKPKDDIHHIFKGHKQRHLADEDGLMIPLCREHHSAVHQHKELNVLCEIIGQLAWEREYLIENTQLPFDDLSEEARDAFRYRYGRSYL
jgi:hypothetical protein